MGGKARSLTNKGAHTPNPAELHEAREITGDAIRTVPGGVTLVLHAKPGAKLAANLPKCVKP